MWKFITHFILRNRLAIIISLSITALVMSYFASYTTITWEFPKILPQTDTTYIKYQEFKNKFGEDGTVLIIGIQDKDFFQKEKYNAWDQLASDVKKIDGIQEVVSISRLYNLSKNDSLEKFEFKPVFTGPVQTQEKLDSIKDVVLNLPFYEGFIYDKKSNSTVMAITFNKTQLNSKARLSIVPKIKEMADKYGTTFNTEIHYSGLPFIRTIVATMVSTEMFQFLGLALLVTIVVLLIFFKNWQAVAFSMLVVLLGMITSFGTIYLMGYQITILSGLIPPLIIVIGVPNCIFLINTYFSDYLKHGNQARALTRMISRAGVSLFFANVTTSIGFYVFVFTHSKILVEFGRVAALNVMVTYIFSMILLPTIYSYLKPPKSKHTKHVEGKRSSGLLLFIDRLVQKQRKAIYFTVVLLCLISAYGLTKLKALGYVVDDLPKGDKVYSDMDFFEEIYHGVLPFEISIDTKKEKGVFQSRTIYKIHKLQKMLAEYKEFSKPLSIVEAIKFSNQAYHEGKRKFYILPGAADLKQIADYAANGSNPKKQDQLKAFVDSTKRYTRVSIQMADIGSIEMKKLLAEIKPKIDSIFNFNYDNKMWETGDNKFDVSLTGNSLMFLKGNDYLVKNLIESVGIAIFLITLVMISLFASIRMIFISIVPSLIPLLITAGLMGYLGINLKPSTILIFSIAFGIASDGTLYFLTKYRHELKNNNLTISKAVSISIKEVGLSMIFTAIILACGFGIFTASTFGGTKAVGFLIPVTLIFAYASNLILLPSFLLSLEKYITKKEITEKPLFEVDQEEIVKEDEYKDLKIE